MILVNLGCGHRHHPAWQNYDLVPSSEAVKPFDITKPLPLETNSCDAVYHAAVLEHIRPVDVPGFLGECVRILKPGGVLRVGIPDLEGICRLYLQKLDAAAQGVPNAEADYDWMMLELLDQMVRERSGGAMMEYFRQPEIPNVEFVLGRIGVEGQELIDLCRTQPEATVQSPLRAFLGDVKRTVKSALAGDLTSRTDFRHSGEVHQWMYDRFSLARLFRRAGLQAIQQRSARESAISNWQDYHLDVTPDGTVNKPDLIFMEGVK